MFLVDKTKYFAAEMIQEYGTAINPKIYLNVKQAFLSFVSLITEKLYSLE